MMRIKVFTILILAMLVMTSCGKDTTPQVAFTAGSQAWIDAPLAGSQLPLAPVEIVAHASSPSGIVFFEVNLNGQPLAQTMPDLASFDQTLMYTRHTWQPAAPGSYLIEVKAYNQDNLPGPPAQVMVVIGQRETPTPTLTATPTLTPTEQYTPTVTPTSIPCDLAAFVGDVTVPDGTDFSAGEKFKKIWRLQNVGSCTWTTGYQVVFVSGDQLDAPPSLKLGNEVPPGESIDITVPMRAPEAPGRYRSYWKLRNPQGDTFSFANGAAFYVEIEVPEAPGPTKTVPPRQGCTVNVPGMLGGITECKYPCPPGAVPGLPCTP